MTLNSMPTLNIDFDAIAVGWLALLNEYQLVIMAYGMMPLEAYKPLEKGLKAKVLEHGKMPADIDENAPCWAIAPGLHPENTVYFTVRQVMSEINNEMARAIYRHAKMVV
jgi:hypothetical protein